MAGVRHGEQQLLVIDLRGVGFRRHANQHSPIAG
jgi:hypothetical protein